jgi:hypothetical protein
MTCMLFEHFSHIALHMKIINTFETQQQQGLTVFEEALNIIETQQQKCLTVFEETLIIFYFFIDLI